jgi:magnesium chelatase family protein
MAALIGGGQQGHLRVGEITLAHRGVLFLDELGEFSPAALDALRLPLEDGAIRIARAGCSHELPASFLLLACCNPCPCGLPEADCRCTDVQRQRYRRRLSAPLLDRFDVRIRVEAPDRTRTAGETSAVVRERVLSATARQHRRLAGTPWRANAEVPAGALGRLAPLDEAAADALHEEAEQRSMSRRGIARVHRVARTVADLDDAPIATIEHVLTAIAMRQDVP